MKIKKMESSTFIRRAVLIVCPLGIAFVLIAKLVLDDKSYVAFVEGEILTIYAAFFLTALYATFVKPRG